MGSRPQMDPADIYPYQPPLFNRQTKFGSALSPVPSGSIVVWANFDAHDNHSYVYTRVYIEVIDRLNVSYYRSKVVWKHFFS